MSGFTIRRSRHPANPWHRPSGLMILLSVLISLAGAASAGEWTGTLKGGGTISVDPHTNRATVTRDGISTQLWDGVHQLQDGTTLTIRSGIAVPTVSILESREPEPEDEKLREWIGAPIVGYSPCERLVRDVCGSSDECATAAGCEPAKQLLDMEQQERQANSTPNIMTFSSAQCQEAGNDKALFVTCGQPPASTDAATWPAQASTAVSPCQQLVYRVCGRDNACAAEQACEAARQTVILEEQDRIDNNRKSYSQNPTSVRCRDLLVGDSFFKACPK